MAIEILTDRNTNQSVMFCNTSEIAFGPVFGEYEDPLDFLDWVNDGGKIEQPLDVRRISSEYLSNLVDNWRKQVEENENEEAGTRTLTEPEAWEGGFAKNN